MSAPDIYDSSLDQLPEGGITLAAPANPNSQDFQIGAKPPFPALRDMSITMHHDQDQSVMTASATDELPWNVEVLTLPDVPPILVFNKAIGTIILTHDPTGDLDVAGSHPWHVSIPGHEDAVANQDAFRTFISLIAGYVLDARKRTK